MDPEVNCTLAVQIPVVYPRGGTVCFYPSPLEEEVLVDTSILGLKDPVEEDCQLPAIQSCNKASFPIARLQELVDQEDISDNLSYRCPQCSKCLECRHSNKLRAMSMQERREQTVIEENVTLDLESRIVTVQLPFMKDPVKYLVEMHQDDSNYGQAIRVYISQCRKDPKLLEGIRKAHRELVEKGFMVPWSHWMRGPSGLSRVLCSATTTCGGWSTKKTACPPLSTWLWTPLCPG